MLFEINNNYCYAVDHSPQKEEKKEPLVDRILKLLKESQKPMTVEGIRKELKGDYTKYKPPINYLSGEGLIKKVDSGYVEA